MATSNRKPDVALSALAVGVLEVDHAIGGVDRLGQCEPCACGQGEVDRYFQAARHLGVHLVVVGELLGGDGCRSARGTRQREAQR